MKIAKARIKRLEEIDPALLCCEERINNILEESKYSYEIQVYPETAKECTVICSYCGSERKAKSINFIRSFRSKTTHRWMNGGILEELDLDEAECQPSN